MRRGRMQTKADDDAQNTYMVVRNAEEQYSIWLTDHAIPAGWSEVGKVGTKDDCVAFIHEIWTDMRPLSVRRALHDNR